MEFIFHHRATHGKRPTRDAEGVITSLGILGETVDENSTYITEDIQSYYHWDLETGVQTTATDLAVGEMVTVEFDYDGEVDVYDLYRVS